MLLWCDGFDHYGTDVGNMLDGAWAQVGAGTTISTVNPRTGARHLRLATNAIVRRVLGGDKTTVGMGYAFHVPSLPISNGIVTLMSFRDNANSEQCRLVLQSDGRIEMFRSSTSLGASGQVVTAGAYHHIEARVVIDDAAGEAEVRVNGVAVLDITGADTKATAVAGVAQVAISRTSTSPNLDIDDIFCWDDQGSYNNDFIGDHRVRTLVPDQDTLAADWTVTGAGSGFAAIDELTPDDDTSYIEGTPGDISEFGLEDLPAEVSAIAGVVAVGRMRKTDSGVCNVQMSMVSAAVGSPPAPAVANGADRPITQVYTYWQDVFEEDPATGAPWSRTGFNAALIRFDRTA